MREGKLIVRVLLDVQPSQVMWKSVLSGKDLNSVGVLIYLLDTKRCLHH